MVCHYQAFERRSRAKVQKQGNFKPCRTQAVDYLLLVTSYESGNGFEFDQHLILDNQIGAKKADLAAMKVHDNFAFEVKRNSELAELHSERTFVYALQKT